MKQRRKICHQLDSSKECNSDSKESSQNEVSEVCWAIKDYFTSKEEVGYRITGKNLQNEKTAKIKNENKGLENGKVFPS